MADLILDEIVAAEQEADNKITKAMEDAKRIEKEAITESLQKYDETYLKLKKEVSKKSEGILKKTKSQAEKEGKSITEELELRLSEIRKLEPSLLEKAAEVVFNIITVVK